LACTPAPLSAELPGLTHSACVCLAHSRGNVLFRLDFETNAGKFSFDFRKISAILNPSKNVPAPRGARGGYAVNQVRPSALFTTRELEILELLGQGKTSKEIAVLMNVRVTTIASHRKNICRKLGVHSTAELIFYAVVGQGVYSTRPE